MKIEINNLHLKKVAEFLDGVKLAGKASRGKTKLLNKLVAKLQEFSEDFNKIKEGKSDADGQNDELIELANEISVIDMSEYPHLVQPLFAALDNYEEAINGEEAIAYDILMTAYESNNDLQDSDSIIEDAQFQEVE